MDRTRMRFPATAGVLLFMVLAGGTWLRLANLGEERLRDDELNHYYAARSIADGKGPLLPSGRVFDRGLDVTRLIDLTSDHVDSVEQAVRLPAAAFGVINLLLIAAAGWILGGPWAALFAALLLAIDPEALFQARHTRFYTYQLNFGLIALVAGWFALRDAGTTTPPDGRAFRRSWLWAALAAGALLYATHVQVVTLSTATAWGLCCVAAATLDVRARGWSALRNSVPLQLVLLGFIAVAVVTLAYPARIANAVDTARSVPYWAAAGGEASRLYYYYALSDAFPLLVSFGPLIFLLLLFKSPRLGLYLLLWFAVPLALHSIVLPWKGMRFVLLALPALYLAAAVVVADLVPRLATHIQQTLQGYGLARAPARRLGVALVFAACLAVVVTTPAFNQARKTPWLSDFPRWDRAGDLIRSMPEIAALPLGSSLPLASMLYWGRVDFDIQIGALHNSAAPPEPGKVFGWAPMGSLDVYAGVPVLTTPEAVREHYAGVGAVVIGIDNMRLESNNVEKELHRVLASEGVELCRGQCGSMLLYLWQFGEEK